MDAVLTFITDCSIAGSHLYEWKIDCRSQEISYSDSFQDDPYEKEHSCSASSTNRLGMFERRKKWIDEYLKIQMNVEVANIRQNAVRATTQLTVDRLGSRVFSAHSHTVGEGHFARTIESTFPCNRILSDDLLPRMVQQRDLSLIHI